ncbi:hypothetical protein C4K02_1665 [Pseudomonas synxantha]|nr:hypothetical protein C4K02_1665 [Pseudomonas synxantha]
MAWLGAVCWSPSRASSLLQKNIGLYTLGSRGWAQADKVVI